MLFQCLSLISSYREIPVNRGMIRQNGKGARLVLVLCEKACLKGGNKHSHYNSVKTTNNCYHTGTPSSLRKGTWKGGKMKIDLKEFNDTVRDYMHMKGVSHFSIVASYGSRDEIKMIMIIPRRGDEKISGEDMGLQTGQSMEQECDERLPV